MTARRIGDEEELKLVEVSKVATNFKKDKKTNETEQIAAKQIEPLSVQELKIPSIRYYYSIIQESDKELKSYIHSFIKNIQSKTMDEVNDMRKELRNIIRQCKEDGGYWNVTWNSTFVGPQVWISTCDDHYRHNDYFNAKNERFINAVQAIQSKLSDLKKLYNKIEKSEKEAAEVEAKQQHKAMRLAEAKAKRKQKAEAEAEARRQAQAKRQAAAEAMRRRNAQAMHLRPYIDQSNLQRTRVRQQERAQKADRLRESETNNPYLI